MRDAADGSASARPARVPLLVKIAPDLADDDVLAVADLALELGLDGIIATNTTIARDGLASDPAEVERVGAGGLSGRPLRSRATEVVRLLRERVGPDLTLVGVGGITTADDARERLAAGATLLQGYTAFVYEGPWWPRRVVRGLRGSRMTTDTAAPERTPLHVAGELLATRRIGAYHHLTVVAPGVAERFRPGTFVAVSTGAERLARRAFWIHRVKPSGGYGATLELVVEVRGPGTRWLAAQTPGTPLQVTGPLGRPFALPAEAVPCLLVGEGYAAAPLFPLAERLRERDCAVSLLVAGSDEAHLLSALEARRSARAVTVVTGDGSVGQRGTRRRRGRGGAAALGRRRRLRRRLGAHAARRRRGGRGGRRLEPGRPRAAADLRHRPVPGLPGPGRRRERRAPAGPGVRRRPRAPRRPGRLGRAGRDR